ncbi:MAG TPA: FAD-binding protein, partial [Steroidobacteraceae bacterium]|nr:FAD-binding protein [Steroidobacteraceae bacterium]
MTEAHGSVLEGWRAQVAAAARGGVALRLRGAGTKDFYGECLAGEVMDLRGFRGIVDYEPSELVITVRCGTPLSEVEAVLAARDQFL